MARSSRRTPPKPSGTAGEPAGARTIRTSKTLITALAVALAALPFKLPLDAQTLARPGWAGFGIAPQSWFKHAVLYEIDARAFQDSNGDGTGDLKGIAQRLDYIRSLGVDAIVLVPLNPPPTPLQTGQPNAIDPALGTLDDFDDLSLAASRLGIRVLLDLPNPDPALARFWLSRGVAGFHVPARNSAGQPNTAAIQAIRKLLHSYVGQRVLITDADTAEDSPQPGVNELLLDTALLRLPAPPAAAAAQSTVAAQLRAALEAAQTPARSASLLLATDAPGLPHSSDRIAAAQDAAQDSVQDAAQDAAQDAVQSAAASGRAAGLGRIAATILLLSRSGVLLSAGQELALPSPSGAAVAIPWGAPPAPPAPASPGPSAAESPATPKSAAPLPAVSDVYVPYVAPRPAAKPASAPPPDPASVAGQELDPKSPLSFYRKLNQLRHGGTALRDGDETFLDYDALNALVWIRKPASPSYANPPVVVLCNLSDKPLAIDLRKELIRLRLRGSFLRTILRSGGGMGAMDLSPVRIPPYGVYIGALKF
jgi:alpha-glucosidase